MVNIIAPSDQPGRAVAERGSIRAVSAARSRSHHNWGVRFGRRREEVRRHPEPTNLHELEEQASRSVELMAKHGTQTKDSFKMATSLLRQQYNLNFRLACKICPNRHEQDELDAPER